MASGSFARCKEEQSASASMLFAGNINQGVEVLLKTSSLFDPFPPEGICNPRQVYTVSRGKLEMRGYSVLNHR